MKMRPISQIRVVVWTTLLLLLILPSQIGAQTQLRARDLTFEPTRIDGALAYRAYFTISHPFSPRRFIKAVELDNTFHTGINPKISDIQLIDQGPGWFLVLQTFVVRVLMFSDFTHMVLRFNTEWLPDHGIIRWYLQDSPDNKMRWVQGSWTVKPANGTDLDNGPSIVQYEILAVFNRTDYFFEQILGSFGAIEVRNGINAALKSLYGM
jgi:hypothetical protein